MPLALTATTGFADYVAGSPWIDTDHPAIAEQGRRLAAPAVDRLDLIGRCFNFVRDEIRHTWDFRHGPITCRASDVLEAGTGYCYAKSHLLAALLRSQGIATGLCYQRLSLGTVGPPYCLHGLNAVYLEPYGWHRIDARGNKPGVNAWFEPPVEHLAFPARTPDEVDFAEVHACPLPEIVRLLTRNGTPEAVQQALPSTNPLAPGAVLL